MSHSVDQRARRVLPDAEAVARHDASVFLLRQKRDAAMADVPDYERLRAHAAQLKDHTLDHLDHYLERFEAKARDAGAVVHVAADAAALCRSVEALLRERDVGTVVKSKSMLTEECGLNPYLEAHGIEVVDTDLGERIVQLRPEAPSHIIVPAIHRSRKEVGELFHRHLGSPEGEEDPGRLMGHARTDLRARFLNAQAGITGANFAIAETGTLGIVTNEGNADLGTGLPPLHVACLGIEKVIPRWDDAAALLRLLARSATGQPLSAYTTFLTGPRPGAELHIFLVDNGRTRLLADPEHRRALRCIRCGACLNTCPVYRRAGGHAYGVPIPGPIGAVLAPAQLGTREAASLPLASSLCGSCTAVCPVGIDLHAQLLSWRRREGGQSPALRRTARWAAAVMARPRLFRAAGRVARLLWPWLGRLPFVGALAGWRHAREWPIHPGPSFAERWQRERGTRR